MIPDEKCTTEYNLLLVGETHVGKTSILLKFTEGKFNETHLTTIGIDYKTKYITIDDIKVKLLIWDSAGQERFHSITQNYFKGAHGIIFVYDITKKESFENIKEWIKQAEHSATKKNYKKIIILVDFIIGIDKVYFYCSNYYRNKTDCEELREVELQQLVNLATKKKCSYVETSAKTGHNIVEIFNLLVSDLIKSSNGNMSVNGLKLDDIKEKKKCGC